MYTYKLDGQPLATATYVVDLEQSDWYLITTRRVTKSTRRLIVTLRVIFTRFSIDGYIAMKLYVNTCYKKYHELAM